MRNVKTLESPHRHLRCQLCPITMTALCLGDVEGPDSFLPPEPSEEDELVLYPPGWGIRPSSDGKGQIVVCSAHKEGSDETRTS